VKATFLGRPATWWQVLLLCGAMGLFLWLTPPWVWVVANLVVNGPRVFGCGRRGRES